MPKESIIGLPAESCNFDFNSLLANNGYYHLII